MRRSDSRNIGRRGFMTASALAASGLVGGARLASAIEPLARDASKFKFSLAAYSYRNLLQGDQPQMTLFDFVDDCARFGLEGTELTSYYFPKDADPDYLRQLKRHCFRNGLDVSGTAVGNDFGHPAGDRRNQEIANVKKWIEYAEILGAPVIRIFAGHRQDGASESETHELIVSGIAECCEFAGQHGVHLALENHGGPTATADGLLAIVRDVDSDWFGVNLDTGNFHSQDIYGDLARAAPYSINVQVKVAVAGPDRKKQPTDYQRLAKILRDANYRGYVVLEFEETGDPREGSQSALGELRKSFS